MEFIVRTVLPIILFMGFISYVFKVYYHFLYLKIIKKYPNNLNFFHFLNTETMDLIDRFEIILPFIIIRKNIELSNEESQKVSILKKRIMICILIFIVGFVCVIPLGIFLQNKHSFKF